MIRLGSLAGYPFEGPRLLGGWTPPAGRRRVRDHVQARPGDQAGPVRGHLRRPLRGPVRRALPVPAPARRLLGAAGPATWKVYICTYEVPGGTAAHREQIARELDRDLPAGCNEQQYDQAWKDEWIGEYSRRPPPAAHPPRPRPSRRPGRQRCGAG